VVCIAIAALAPGAVAQCPTVELSPPIQFTNDWFGHALDVDGDLLAVGSQHSVTIFVRDSAGTPVDSTDDSFEVQEQILSFDPFNADDFGLSVDLDGTRLIVGAPAAGGLASLGAAIIFRKVEGGRPNDPLDDSWAVEKVFGPLSAAAPGKLGSAVGLRGDWAFAGEPFGQTSAGVQAGVVHVLRLSSAGRLGRAHTGWAEVQVLEAAGSAALNEFGGELVVSDGRLLVGASKAGGGAGAVHAFRLDDGSTPLDPLDDHWLPQGVLVAPLGDTFFFGQSLSLHGDRLLVGAVGVAFEFVLDNAGTLQDPSDDAWIHSGTLQVSGLPLTEGFGRSVALHGDLALVGAMQFGPVDAGAAHLFRRTVTPGWELVTVLQSAQPLSSQKFGAQVLVDDGLAFVAERGVFISLAGDTSQASPFGKVSAFALAKPPWKWGTGGLAGPFGAPCLVAFGAPETAAPAQLTLVHGASSAPVALVLGGAVLGVPFKGGVLVPEPHLVVWLQTNADGGLSVSGHWPAPLPALASVHAQAWFPPDSLSPAFAASNSLSVELP
jgi:hypothetical protein